MITGGGNEGPQLFPSFLAITARTEAQREMVFALRREAFGKDADFSALNDEYDDALNCQSFLLCHADHSSPIGSVRSCIYSSTFDWLPVPAFDLYGEEIRDAFGAGTSLEQSSHFCVSSANRGADILPKLLLMREIVKTAVESEAAMIVTIVRHRQSQLSFYKRMGFQQFGPVKTHPLGNCEATLIGVATTVLLNAVRKRRLLRPIGEF
jgi:hypothetical protein